MRNFNRYIERLIQKILLTMIKTIHPIIMLSVFIFMLLTTTAGTWISIDEAYGMHSGSVFVVNKQSQTDLEQWQQVSVLWRVDDNFRNEGGRFAFTITIINESAEPIPADGWALYFNFQRIVADDSVPDDLDLTRINGDFYKLEPASGFEIIPAKDQRSFSFEGFGSAICYSDAPAGFYVVEGDNHDNPQAIGPVRVAPIEEDYQLNRSPNDNVTVSTPDVRFRENEQLEKLPAEAVNPILPTPKHWERLNETVTIDASWTIHHDDGLASEAGLLADRMETIMGSRPEIFNDMVAKATAINLRLGEINDPDGDESYQLQINPNHGIEIVAPAPAGIFYGIQSLISLMPVDTSPHVARKIDMPSIHILDAPRFPYRGFHLDVSRHFESTDDVKRLLDILSFYKLNRFHFHLTDDEGWRLEINGLPELTDIGGHRGHTLDERDHLIPSLGSGPDPTDSDSHGNGYYDRDEYIEILRYAAERHIEVIPEIDVPGHARAAIVAMEARYHRLMEEGNEAGANEFRLRDPDDQSKYRSAQEWEGNVMNICIPSAYHFMQTVIDDIIAMHEEADVPITTIHIGGDEVPDGAWTASPACDKMIAENDNLNNPKGLESYFIERLTGMLAERDLVTGGWEEAVLVPSEIDDGYMWEPNSELKEQPFITYIWKPISGGRGDDRAYRLANAGYDVILAYASSLYFDVPYEKHPAEPGLYWPGFVDLKDPFFFTPFDVFQTIENDALGNPLDHERIEDHARHRIRGIQGQLWGQLWNDAVVKVERLDYMAFPRALALAERAWAPQPSWKDESDTTVIESERFMGWQHFTNQLGQFQLPRLDNLFAQPVAYRLPPPGAIFKDGYLHANLEIPGLTIRYTIDGSEPTSSSKIYKEPIRLNNSVKLCSFDTNGRGSRTVEIHP